MKKITTEEVWAIMIPLMIFVGFLIAILKT